MAWLSFKDLFLDAIKTVESKTAIKQDVKEYADENIINYGTSAPDNSLDKASIFIDTSQVEDNIVLAQGIYFRIP